MSNIPTSPDEVPPPTVIRSQVTFSTPIKRSLQGSQQFYSGTPMDASEFQGRMAQELQNQWVGPMPINKFMEEFLPIPAKVPSPKPTFAKEHFVTMADYKAEKDMYDPFIALVESAHAMPGFKLVNTSVNFDPTLKQVPGMKNKPDVCGYKNGVNTNTIPTKYEDMELIFEFKPASAQANPFNDPPKKSKELLPEDFEFENTGKQHALCRGQLACYARVWTAKQHRTHCFMVWIGGPYARIIRLDRSGGIVSEQFQYEANAPLLLEFLWRFSITSDEARGMDPTVTRASLAETKLAQDKLYAWKRGERSVFKLKIPDPTQVDLNKNTDVNPDPAQDELSTTHDVTLDRTPDDSRKTRDVLVWGPLADPQSVTGRATRGYPALDLTSGKTVFVKDSWRACGPGMEKESDILRYLNEKKVRNVPQILCGDDLPGQHQTTATQDFANEDWNAGARKAQFVQRVHTRFAEDFIGLPLYKFASAKQFLQAVYDAFLAHKDAYEKCGILHRDISAGNVLLKAGGGGILNDWDLARYVDKDDRNKHHPCFRSGTWQFMSIGLLTNPAKIHHVQDDMESFFWLVLYHILRYMKHDKVTELEVIMDAIFDQFTKAPKTGALETGGVGKLGLLAMGTYIGSDFEVAGNQPLTDFYDSGRKIWKAWYSYIGERQDDINKLRRSARISHEEASNRVPFVHPPGIIDHSHMSSLFASALASGNWPSDVEAVDYLSKTEKRGRDEDQEEDPVYVKSGTKAKRSTISMDNMTYKPSTKRSMGSSNLRPLPALNLQETAPVTRAQSKAAGLSGDSLNEVFS
ncbi:hypothetical protein CVT25_003907 [Psilocybe cyanescens]|uniref:Fungal-type protein kinase domain-containing protein n=1 Tax=Psilocybe cyanescens TaxID=93625 RepID=A0A409XQ21_PSICY|nr:hypothetical protein CVT25_003907 [Psilocybe cyanescens]